MEEFTLVTDHKPLTTILNPQKGIPSLAAACLQCWAIILSAYMYEIEFKCTQDHGNADGLSRLSLPNVKSPKSHAVDVFTVAQLDSLPVIAEQLGLGWVGFCKFEFYNKPKTEIHLRLENNILTIQKG